MRKVFALLAGLIMLATLSACSDDDTNVPTPPQPTELSISTAEMPVGYTCTPYNLELEATGGTAPYTWALAEGSTLPDGLTLSADGTISGVASAVSEMNVTFVCTDAAGTPATVEKEFTMNVAIPSNPSMAVYFDSEGSTCKTELGAWTALTCYVYIMMQDSDLNCAQACEFQMRLADATDADLVAGTQYIISSVSYPSHVSLTLGSPFSGIAMGFNTPIFGPDPIHVATFNLILMEDLNEIAFKFQPNPGGYLAVAACDQAMTIVEVNGREAAINY